MKKKIQILCPEYVPLENKGEEAIIRGTIDVVFPKFDCEYHIVDLNSDIYRFIDGIHVHPGSLFFSDWRSREFGLGFSWEEIYSSSCSLIRNGLNKFFPVWITKPHKQAVRLKEYLSEEKSPPLQYKPSIEALKKIDYIIAGHNGGLDVYVCHILNELNSIGKRYGIFGSSMKPNLHEKRMLSVFKKTFDKSEFNIARNPLGYSWAKKYFKDIKFELKPDPAFGMIPISKNETESLISELNIERLFEKPVIMVTTAEPAPIARHSFIKSVGPKQKIDAHRVFLADLLKLIRKKTDVNIVFLPHTIGPDKKMDDREISNDVIKRAGLTNDSRVILLTADLNAKQLKGLINRADFLIAERVHSIIGAIGVNTPFLSLASKTDTRIEGILNQQMNLGNYIYYLKTPEPSEAFDKFQQLLSSKSEIKKALKELNIKINDELTQTGSKLENFILKQ
jgi:polysaccharide pyruvyl transferase WcaK-like protein